jgi:hypothetical protein
MEWGIGISVTNPENSAREWIRKVEFETKAACPAEATYFRFEGPSQALRITLTEVPETLRENGGRLAAKYMNKRAQ